MSAPRIDTVRNRLGATIALLELVRGHVTDLHDLAYFRRLGISEPKVRGGSRDYALDTHGDPKARDLYASLATELLTLIDAAAVKAHEVVRFMQAGEPPARRRTATGDCLAEEVLAAIDAQQRRNQQGDHSPGRNFPQPKVKPSMDHAKELAALTSALKKVHPNERPDRSRLTPLEVDAWRRAHHVEEVKTA